MSDTTRVPTPEPTTAAPAPLRDGWRRVRLGEVITEAQSGFASGARDDKGVVQLRMNNVTTDGRLDWASFIRVPATDEVAELYRLQAGDVLFNNTNSTELVGKSALFDGYDEPVVYSNHFTRLRTNSERLLPDFLALWLQEQWQKRTFAEICNKWIGQSAVQRGKLLALEIPLPPLPEQKRIAGVLTEQMAAVERARRAAEEQLELSAKLVNAVLRVSLDSAPTQPTLLRSCLREVTQGVGEGWKRYPVLGATRAGLAPAKEGVGKTPQRYKPVQAGTIFYNPMRILLGSIAMIDDNDAEGITSPDYVVFRCEDEVMHPRWFYHWLRSPYGEAFIKTMSRGAVRERLLFRRLAGAEITVPSWGAQFRAAEQLKEVSRLRRSITEQLAAINRLPAALLRKAFAGEV